MPEFLKLVDEFDFVESIEGSGPSYEIYLKGNAPRPLRVLLRGQKGGFTPEMDHYVQASGAAGPHRTSLHPQGTREDALREVLEHGLMFYRHDDDSAVWIENKLFGR